MGVGRSLWTPTHPSLALCDPFLGMPTQPDCLDTCPICQPELHWCTHLSPPDRAPVSFSEARQPPESTQERRLRTSLGMVWVGGGKGTGNLSQPAGGEDGLPTILSQLVTAAPLRSSPDGSTGEVRTTCLCWELKTIRCHLSVGFAAPIPPCQLFVLFFSRQYLTM